jgi:hypothetical protein
MGLVRPRARNPAENEPNPSSKRPRGGAAVPTVRNNLRSRCACISSISAGVAALPLMASKSLMMFSFCSASGPLISVNLNFFSSTYANPAAFPKGDILHLLRYSPSTVTWALWFCSKAAPHYEPRIKCDGLLQPAPPMRHAASSNSLARSVLSHRYWLGSRQRPKCPSDDGFRADNLALPGRGCVKRRRPLADDR